MVLIYCITKDSAIISVHACGLSTLNDLDLEFYLEDCDNKVAYDYYYWGTCDGQPKAMLKGKAGQTIFIRWNTYEQKQFGFEVIEQDYVILEGASCQNPQKAYEGLNYANDFGGLFRKNYFTYKFPEDGNLSLNIPGAKRPYYSGFHCIDDDNKGGFFVIKMPLNCSSENHDQFIAENTNWVSLGKNITVSGYENEEFLIYMPEVYEYYEWNLSFSAGNPIKGLSCTNPLPLDTAGNYKLDFSKLGNSVRYMQYTPIKDTTVFFTGKSIVDYSLYICVSPTCAIFDSELDIINDTASSTLHAGVSYTIAIITEEFEYESELQESAVYELNIGFSAPADKLNCDSVNAISTGIHKADNSKGNDVFKFIAPEEGDLIVSSCGFTEEDTYVSLSTDCNGAPFKESDNYQDVQSYLAHPCSTGEELYIIWEDQYTNKSFDWELKFITETDFIDFAIQGAERSVFDYTNHTINIPANYYLDISSVIPEFEAPSTSDVTIGGIKQESGVSVVDFSNPLTYNVAGQDWVVSVIKNASPSSEKEILSLSFSEQKANPEKVNDSTFKVELYYSEYSYEFTPTLSDQATLFNDWGEKEEYHFVYFSEGVDSIVWEGYVMAEDSTTKNWNIQVIRSMPDSGKVCEFAFPVQLGQNNFPGHTYDTWYAYTPTQTGVINIYGLNDINTEYIELHLYRGSCDGEDEYYDIWDVNDTTKITVSSTETIYFSFDEDVTQFTIEESTEDLSSEKNITEFYSSAIDLKSLTINNSTRTVDIIVDYDTDISSLSFWIYVNKGALISYKGDTLNSSSDESGDIDQADLSSPLYLTIIAPDGSESTWMIRVNKALPKTGNDILAFNVLQQIVPASIDSINHKVSMYLYPTADLTNLYPNYVLSEKAKAYVNDFQQYNSISAQNFSSPVTYTIKAQDGSTQNWLVEATKASDSDARILDFFINRQISPAEIDEAKKEINIIVAYETDLSNIIPEFKLSPGATCKVNGTLQESGVTTVDLSSNSITYNVVAKDNTTETWTINVAKDLPMPEICMVTVDSATGNNLIVWEKSSHDALDHYNVYKENASAQWEKIGEVAGNDTTVYEDKNSNPNIQAEKYKVAIEDINGEESKHSGYHQTIHLNINVASGGGANLIWNHYMDEQNGIAFGNNGTGSYYIYRGTSPDNPELYHTLSKSNTSWTDPSDTSTLYYYRIAVEKNVVCDPLNQLKASAGPFSQSISNLEDNRLREQEIGNLVMMNNNNIHIYPNPFKKDIHINYTLTTRSSIKFELYNIMGEQIKQINKGIQLPGEYRGTISMTHEEFKKGIYLLKVIINDQIYCYKVIAE